MKQYKSEKRMTAQWLTKHGFRYFKMFSDDKESAYVFRFPCYKNGSSVILECETIAFIPSQEIKVNVFDGKGTRNLWAPYYYIEYGNYSDEWLNQVNNSIDKELKKLKIIEDTTDDNNRQGM